MKVTELLNGVLLLEPKRFVDERGFYCEVYSSRTLQEIGITDVFVQDNHFLSLKAGTIRGIHFQDEPMAQSKLIWCSCGSFMDVAVDLRVGSPTYKRWTSAILSAQDGKQLYIPRGFGHCCMSLEDMTEGQYKVDSLYAPEYAKGILWNDPELGIEWPDLSPIVSAKDRGAPPISECDIHFEY